MMKKWNESDWFNTWVVMAWKDQNARRREEGRSEVPIRERQITTRTDLPETVSDPEWQVTE